MRKKTGIDRGTLYAMKIFRQPAQIRPFLEKMYNEEMVGYIRRLSEPLCILLNARVCISQILMQFRTSPFLATLQYVFIGSTHIIRVFDYVAGGQLVPHLSTAPDVDGARFHLAELVLAIEQLHQRHIIYGDLRPQNILLDEHGHLVLTGFARARQLEAGGDFTVDWRSLGQLIFELLTRKAPAVGAERQRRIPATSSELLLRFAQLDAVVGDLLMLLVSPHRQPSAIAIKAHPFFASMDWRDLAEGRLVPPYRPTIVVDMAVDADADAADMAEMESDDNRPLLVDMPTDVQQLIEHIPKVSATD